MKNFKYFILTKSIGIYINFLLLVAPKSALNLGYKLFSQPRKGKYQLSNQPKFLKNLTHSIEEINQNKFSVYIKHGSSEKTILLVHGWESNASRWELLIDSFQKFNHTIIAIEAPAHGLSKLKEFNVPKYAEYIDHVCRKYQINYIIAHSLGGASSVYYQRFYQNPLIKKIVLIGAPSDLRVLINNFISLLSIHPKIISLFDKFYKKQFNLNLDEFSSVEFSKKIITPALIIHDKSDTVVNFSEAEKTIINWKNAELFSTENLDHSMHGQIVYEKIIQFINQ